MTYTENKMKLNKKLNKHKKKLDAIISERIEKPEKAELNYNLKYDHLSRIVTEYYKIGKKYSDYDKETLIYRA